MIDVEPLIVSELERMLPLPAGTRADWADVLGRAGIRGARSRRRLTPRRAGLYALAIAIVVYLAAPALGVGTPFLDFFSAKHAPKRVVKDFRQQNAAGSHGIGVNPKVLAGQARQVTVYHLRNGKAFPLDVAPRRGGGFCFDFGYGGSCAAPHPRRGPDQPGDHNGSAIALILEGLRGTSVLAGYVYDQHIAELQVRGKHGSAVDVPVLWVSPPINAGFFLYNLTNVQRRRHTIAAIVALDAQGKVLARIASIFRPRPAWANWRNVADLSKRHVILRSGQATIAIAPSRTGGYCFWLRSAGGAGGSGCAPPRYLTQPMVGGLGGTVFSAQVKPVVGRVELRFQDGTRTELHPVEGFVLYSIPASHWPRGHRLTAAIAYSSAARQLMRQTFDPGLPGVYPCLKPRPLGAGLKACP
jgi:hypothetical protein